MRWIIRRRGGSPDEGGGGGGERVLDPPPVEDHEIRGQRARQEPLDGKALPRRRARRPARQLAVETEIDVVPHPPVGIADDLPAGVRIDADQAPDRDLVARFLVNLADDGVGHRLPDLHRATRQAPLAIVRALLEEDLPRVEDDRRHARPNGLHPGPVTLDLHDPSPYSTPAAARNAGAGPPGQRTCRPRGRGSQRACEPPRPCPRLGSIIPVRRAVDGAESSEGEEWPASERTSASWAGVQPGSSSGSSSPSAGPASSFSRGTRRSTASSAERSSSRARRISSTPSASSTTSGRSPIRS